MKYLLELNKFGDVFDKENVIDELIKKLNSSGYISTSTKNKLEEVIGVNGSIDDLINQSEEIVEFYDKYPLEFFDDIMLEFFDESSYTYSIKIGAYMSKNHIIGNNNDHLKYYIIDESEYELSIDKTFTLFVGLLKFIRSLTKENFKNGNINYADRKSRDSWIREPRSRSINLVNCFSYIKSIQPCVYLYINHKEREGYYYNGDIIDSGWTQKDIGAYYWVKQDSLVGRIKKRLGNFGINIDISDNYNYTCYSNQYDENGKKLDIEPTLVSTILRLKIKI